jgi:hypothetical protein
LKNAAAIYCAFGLRRVRRSIGNHKSCIC